MHYEFSTEHNTLFTNLASKLRTVGITFIVLGVLQSFLALINAGTFGIITGVAGGAGHGVDRRYCPAGIGGELARGCG